MAFSEWLLKRNRDNHFLRNLIIGDEAGFSMNGRVNSQNVCYYAPKGNSPNFTYEVSASREKLAVWMGLCGNGSIIGPIFFERNLNGAAYLQMLNEEVFLKFLETFGDLEFRNGYFQRLWWAQDGDPAHGSNKVKKWLQEFFCQHTISLNHPIEWPTHSPDLMP